MGKTPFANPQSGGPDKFARVSVVDPAAQLAGVLGLAAAAVFVHTAIAGRARDAEATHEAAVFLLLGGTVGLLALRHGLPEPWRAASDGTLFQAMHVPAAMSLVVLMHMTAKRLTRHELVALGAAGLYAVLSAASLALVFGADLRALPPRDWIAANPEVASVLFGLFTFPALTAAGLLVFAAHGIGGASARRIRLASLSCSLFYLAFTMDAVDPRPGGAIALGALMLAAAALARLALFPSRWLDDLHGLPPLAARPDEQR